MKQASLMLGHASTGVTQAKYCAKGEEGVDLFDLPDDNVDEMDERRRLSRQIEELQERLRALSSTETAA